MDGILRGRLRGAPGPSNGGPISIVLVRSEPVRIKWNGSLARVGQFIVEWSAANVDARLAEAKGWSVVSTWEMASVSARTSATGGLSRADRPRRRAV